MRSALWWFATHNWQWIEATKDHEILTIASLGQELEAVLEAYQGDLNGASSGVPQSLVRAATGISPDSVSV